MRRALPKSILCFLLAVALAFQIGIVVPAPKEAEGVEPQYQSQRTSERELFLIADESFQSLQVEPLQSDGEDVDPPEDIPEEITEGATRNNVAEVINTPNNKQQDGLLDIDPEAEEDDPLADYNGDPNDLNDVLDYLVSTSYSGIESNSILDYFDLDFFDESGKAVSNPALGDVFNMLFEFTLPSELVAIMTGHEYYTFRMPSELKVNTAQSIPLLTSTNHQYGEVIVSTDGSVIIQFNEYLDVLIGEVNGGGIIYGELVQGGMLAPGENEIKIPDEEEVPGVPIEVKPGIEAGLDKDGDFDSPQNPNAITWTIEFNKNLETLSGVELTDQLPQYLSIQDIQVLGFDVDFLGNIIEDSKRVLGENSDYSISYNENGHPVITFNGTLDYAVRIIIDTDIERDQFNDIGTQITFKNDAFVTSTEGIELDGSASLVASYKTKLGKTAYSYDSDSQTITWKVEYNYNEGVIPAGQQLIDSIPDGLEYVGGSIEIKTVEFDSAGKAQETGNLASEYYSVSEQNRDFIITIEQSIDHPIVIYYQTKATDIVDVNKRYTNYITDNEHSSSGGSYIYQQNVEKTNKGYDISQNTINWRIIVNKNHENINQLIVTDTLDPIPLSLSDIRVTTANGDTLNEISDYDYTYDDLTGIMVFTFKGNYNPTKEKIFIDYKAQYDGSRVPDLIENTARIDWIDDQKREHWSEDNDSLVPSLTIQQNGKKGGNYNAISKEISWFLAVNYSNTGLVNAYVEDVIEAPQHYVDGSLRIYQYSETESGDIERDDEPISPELYSQFKIQEPDESNSYTLRIDIPDSGETDLYYFEFETCLEGEVIGSNTYSNTAYFHNDLTEMMELEADVSVANGGTYVGKQTHQDSSGQAGWTVTVNASQSTAYNVLVRDICDASQIIDVDSVVIYHTTVTEKGVITIDGTRDPLAKDQDYMVSYFLNDEGCWELQIAFINDYEEITCPYIISYDVTVLAENAVPGSNMNIKNDVYITFEKDGEYDDESHIGGTVEVGGGEGWITAALSTLEITKEDGYTRETLQNVQFELYYLGLDGTDTPFLVGSSIQTDGQGHVSLDNMPLGYYELYELEALPGYGYLSPNPYTFQIQGPTDITIQNDPTHVALTKTDADGLEPIEGALFELEQLVDDEWVRILDDREIRSDRLGLIEFLYLETDSKYRLIEVLAPDGYALNSYPYYFDIDEFGETTYLGTETSLESDEQRIRDIPSQIEMVKEDSETGDALEGAQFELYQYNENVTGDEWTRINEDEVYETDSEGVLKIGGLTTDRTYRLIESVAPMGYKLRTDPIDFYLPQQTTDPSTGLVLDPLILEPFGNDPTQVTLTKTDDDSSDMLPNAHFMLEMLRDDEWIEIRQEDSIVSNIAGVVEITHLDVGTQYRLTETLAPDGYANNIYPYYFDLDSFGEVTYRGTGIELGSDAQRIRNLPSQVEMVKVDSNTGNALADAVFELYQLNDQSGEWTRVNEGGEYRSDDQGVLKIGGLTSERTYRLVEVEAPHGYQLNSETIEFYLPTQSMDPLTGIVIDPLLLEDYENVPTFVEIIKTNSDGSEMLQGAQFRLEQLIGDEWKEINLDKQLVSATDGRIQINYLSSGNSYRLCEVRAPEGYAINPAPYYFDIDTEGSVSYLGINDELQEDDRYMRNILTQIEVIKQDELTGKALPGAVFEIYQQEGSAEGVQWNRIFNHLELVSDNDGSLIINGLATEQTYRLVEVQAPDGYDLLAEPIEFYLPAQRSNDTAQYIVDPFQVEPVNNRPNNVQLMKLDENENALSGAMFTLQRYDEDGEEEIPDEGVDFDPWKPVEGYEEISVDEQGRIEITALPSGSYRFIEIDAPEGYVLDESPFEFVLERNEAGAYEEVTLEVVNYPIPEEIQAGTVLEDLSEKTSMRSVNKMGSFTPAQRSGSFAQTGDPFPYLIVGLIVVLALGAIMISIAVYKRKKN